jgi:hypothetical protein
MRARSQACSASAGDEASINWSASPQRVATHPILKDRLQERFPGGEVPVQRGVANPGVAGDVVQ